MIIFEIFPWVGEKIEDIYFLNILCNSKFILPQMIDFNINVYLLYNYTTNRHLLRKSMTNINYIIGYFKSCRVHIRIYRMSFFS